MVQNLRVSPEASTPDVSDRVLLSGVSWATGQPRLHLRLNGEPSTHIPVAGVSLRYSAVDSRRRCVGHKPFRDHTGSWVDCDNTSLHDGYKCDRCAANDATFASQLHHAHTRGTGELDASIQTHLAQPNHLYLAAFRDGSIKVGTSTSSRLDTRLSEQGAWRATIVATTTNGIAVREVEAQITSELGIAQSVSARRKLSGLVNPVSDDRLSTELDRWSTAVHRLIDTLSADEISPKRDQWLSPVIADDVWHHVTAYPLKLRTGSHHVELIAASGRLCALHRPGVDDVFVADLRPLYGLELTMADVEPDELAVQDSLF